jgi:predicted porin
MRRNLTGSVGASYSLANEFNGNDRIFTASAGLNYSLSPQTSTYVSANYVQRQSQNQAALLSNGQVLPVGSYSDASIIVGLRYTLGSPPRP